MNQKLQIHLVIPFYRIYLKDVLIEAYRPMDVILHMVMFQDEEVAFDEPWIFPVVIPMDSKDCTDQHPECFKRNWFITGGSQIFNDDYYVCVDDDDMYEPGVFDAIKKMNDDIVIISMKRGLNVPKDAVESRQYPTDALLADPDNVFDGGISGQQMFVKGHVFKDHSFETEGHWDFAMAYHYKITETIRYEPDLFALFNYYEPGRWEPKPELLSVVIPVHNQHLKAHLCIELISHTMQDFELVVVDDGSKPEFTPRYPCVGFRHGQSIGFTGSANQGIRIANGATIVLLSGDMSVKPKILKHIAKQLHLFDIVLHFTDAGYCAAFKKATFDEVGIFNNKLFPQSNSIIDFCSRAEKRGFTVNVDSYAEPKKLKERKKSMISIVVPVFNNHDFTDECLRAVIDNTASCEIIVVDNGSDPPYRPPFSGFMETKLIKNDTNLGYPVAVNQGIRAASGDTIILLNNDVIVTPDWAERLTRLLDDFAIVGPITNYAAQVQQVEIGVYDSKEGLYDEAKKWTDEYQDAIQEVNFVIGFCMAFRKSLYDEIGEFDESLWPCSGEEIDFCFKTIAAGYKIAVAYDCYVHHEGSMTFRAMEKAGTLDYVKTCIRNDKHLAKKWGNDFWQRQIIETEEVVEMEGTGK